ncbi:hypothetical protein SAMN04489797_1691 [Winogradskyella sediminis]|uniref:Uncharacterized protein n=2 Tax=Winogradskyella sediminis TaxID=1382466 RepID=A0A1H1SJN7_9FLAO|nr:hypothetical protein C8N41_101463 [Winogradskyella sediminis]SDS48083.1 hypothetical protein SAMN04489797_1691 [Winogradskyella sediminis]
MNLLNYLTGKNGLILIGFVVLCVFIYNKYKTQRYFKHVEKRLNEKEKKK